MGYEFNNILPLADRKYILQHEGDFVERVESTGWDTVKTHFVFTDDKSKARRFSFDELYNPKSATVMTDFTRGFSRGKAVRVE